MPVPQTLSAAPEAPGTPAPFQEVSDTARWAAAYRAWESARPDALFRDPYAARLAGARAQAAAKRLRSSRTAGNGWPVILRTHLMDRLVSAAVTDGSGCVLNLAAGFDMRPYRLELPAELRWIEADLPALLEEKARLLAGEPARCRLERVAVDLSLPEARRALFERVAAQESRVTILSEGLLVYLREAAVSALAEALLERPCFEEWIVDFSSPAILELLKRGKGAPAALFRFAPRDGMRFFEARGWRPREVYSLFHEAARHRRIPWLLRPFAWLPPPDPWHPGNKQWAGVARLARPAVHQARTTHGVRPHMVRFDARSATERT